MPGEVTKYFGHKHVLSLPFIVGLSFGRTVAQLMEMKVLYFYELFEPSPEKTNKVVSEQALHKSGYTVTGAS